MAFVKAGPNQFLLTGRGGRLENRGSAVQAFLRPGSVWVLVPATKQEAPFEFTQETKDGIPLRFKGIIIYRVTDPIAAARLFDFASGSGIGQITELLTHVCLGELRHAVSHMTMAQCIEERKTTLSGVAEDALRATVGSAGDTAGGWGVTIEITQLAQVFIVDTGLRQQLEAEVRNEIKLRSDRSAVSTQEQGRLAEMTSEGRIGEQQLAGDRERLRREEELELARKAHRRRMLAEDFASERHALQLEQERVAARMDAEQARVTAEAPVRRLRMSTERDLLGEELEMRALQNQVRALEVVHELALERARQDLRREILPLEQAPRIVEAASQVLHGTNLAVYGEDGRLLGQLAPVFEILGRAVRQAGKAGAARVADEDAVTAGSADA